MVLTRSIPEMIVSKTCSGNNVMVLGHTVAATCLYWKLQAFPVTCHHVLVKCERWLSVMGDRLVVRLENL